MTRVRGLEELLARRTGADQRSQLFPQNFSEPSGPAATSPLVRNVYPPWVYKLPVSVDFNVNVFNSALLGVAGNTVIPVSFTLPPTFVGYLQIFGIYVLNPTASQDVTFTLRINQGPVQGWDNIKFPPGVANFVVQNFGDLQVRIPDGGVVDVLVTNNSANAWTVGAKIAGWFHPENEEQRIYGSL